MRTFRFIAMLYMLGNVSVTTADTFGFVSIPAAAFSVRDSQTGSYTGNESGTARSFSGLMFAPVDIPHGSVVTLFKCGGHPKAGTLVRFALRRNEPQQANVDMAVVESAFSTDIPLIGNKPTGLAQYQFLSTSRIVSGGIDNSIYNYYVVASTIYPPFDSLGPQFSGDSSPYSDCIKAGDCTGVNYCSIGYRFPFQGANKLKPLR
ncbi:hypothetical protein [Thiolapillus brandeum]|uniref:hypothetical protein n=1 Tax=Thiolapillus brandeum TaxID=1076588 RepID=UPI0011867064|nr:hypothetical protein [Thiolapillus brandeum]